MLIRILEDVPLPTIEGQTDKYAYRIKNVVFAHGRDFLPEQIRFHLDTDTSLKMREELSSNELRVFLRVNIDNMDTNLKNVNFWVKKFSKPTYEDQGILDVSAKGISFEFKWRITSKEGRPWKFALEDADCRIKSLKFNIIQAKHKFMDKLYTTLFNYPMKKRMQVGIENFIERKVNLLNRQLNQMFYVAKKQVGNVHLPERFKSHDSTSSTTHSTGTHLTSDKDHKTSTGSHLTSDRDHKTATHSTGLHGATVATHASGERSATTASSATAVPATRSTYDPVIGTSTTTTAAPVVHTSTTTASLPKESTKVPETTMNSSTKVLGSN
jgi:hypothetical protein